MKVTANSSSIWAGPNGEGCIPNDGPKKLPPIKLHDPRYADGFDPQQGANGSVSQRKHNLRGLTDEALANQIKWLKSRIEDAETGPVQSPTQAKRARESLALAEAEAAARKKLGKSEAGKLHRLDTPDLKQELAKQEELLKEATSGVSQDPTAAAKARAEIAAINKELGIRSAEEKQGGQLTEVEKARVIPPAERARSKWADGLRNKTDDQLKKELAALKAKEKDATTGAAKNPNVAANVRTDLALVQKELKLREALKMGPLPQYALKQHQASSPALTHERAVLNERLIEVTTGAAQDPKAAAKLRQQLAIVDAELARRPQPVAVPLAA